MNAMISIKEFNQLDALALYQILKLRFDIFVVEQDCIYNEFDNIDQNALHFYTEENNLVVSYLRLYRKDKKGLASFGRVVTHIDARGKGLMAKLIHSCIEYTKTNWTDITRISISAQSHLQDYYGRFGFQTVSDEYDEDGIMHVEMHINF